MKQVYSKRLDALEAASGMHVPVSAIYLADTDEVVVLSLHGAAEHQRMPRAMFEACYPNGVIVKAYGFAWMWEAA